MVALRRTREGRDKLASCMGKTPFPTKAAALKVAKRMGGGTRVFRCDYCHEFHVGHGRST